MTGIFVKEMGSVPAFMNMHPMMTMLGSEKPGISDMVSISDQAEIALQSWLSEGASKKQ